MKLMLLLHAKLATIFATELNLMFREKDLLPCFFSTNYKEQWFSTLAFDGPIKALQIHLIIHLNHRKSNL